MSSDRKFQIFISSTYEDLKEERNEIIKACLEMGHIPIGMETFNAGDDEQWLTIQKTIDESDYYVVIVAHRYGSLTAVDGRDISFTEKEFNYAVSQGIPTLRFVIDDSALWTGERYQKGDGIAKLLNAFKATLLQDQMASRWTNKDTLSAAFAKSIGKKIRNHPRPGWIRADGAPTSQALAEIAHLSDENRELRKQRQRDSKESIAKIVPILQHFIVEDSSMPGVTARLLNVFWQAMPLLRAGSLYVELVTVVGNAILSVNPKVDNPKTESMVRRSLDHLDALGLIEPYRDIGQLSYRATPLGVEVFRSLYRTHSKIEAVAARQRIIDENWRRAAHESGLDVENPIT